MVERENLSRSEHGQYTEITVEKDFLKLVTTTNFVVCHFYHKDFRRCDIMDKHLEV